MRANEFEVRWKGTVHRGPAIDLGNDVDPEAMGDSVAGDGPFDVRCQSPGPVHDYVGVVTEPCSISVRSALAVAARSRGIHAPMDEEIETVETHLVEMGQVGDPRRAISAAQRRIAEANEREQKLSERVQTLHGRLRALGERDEPVEKTEAALEAATRGLSETETERMASEERLQQRRRSAREQRNQQERRLRLHDKLDNLKRAARDHHAEAVDDNFADALQVVPGMGRPEGDPCDYEGDSITAALAIARVADVRAPIVVACDRFTDAGTASDCLEAPVIKISG